MKFKVLGRFSYIPDSPTNRAYLLKDNWNDYSFETLYRLVYVDSEGYHHKFGEVKIGKFNLGDSLEPDVPKIFDVIPEEFFSLGQDDSYYQEMRSLPANERNEILTALRDIIDDEELLNRALGERVTKVSLLRSVSMSAVRVQFPRILRGGKRLSKYNFSYQAERHEKIIGSPMHLDFHVIPHSNPPTNIHVIIGRNGVGKTYMLNNMVASLIKPNSDKKFGFFEFADGQSFSNIVSVTFSAFDNTDPLPEQMDKSQGIIYSYVGLRKIKGQDNRPTELKNPHDLRTELIQSIYACCKSEAKRERWKRAIESLETDDIFRESQVGNLAEVGRYDIEQMTEELDSFFSKFSSGHMIVILAITKLVEKVAERSLVLIDEPETHLHPPLLAAFTRAVSDLLINRNGVAIVSTHSPVVLQEVPKSCVWKLQRSGAQARADRLLIESFGENVGALTSEVFGLEVMNAGYHQLLKDAIRDVDTYEDALFKFENQLGLEAKGILRGMIELKNREEE